MKLQFPKFKELLNFGLQLSKQSAKYALLAIAATCTVTYDARADTIFGPFSNVGSYTVIPNGGFELGNMSGYSDIISSRGVFRVSSQSPFAGSFSARSETAANFNGFGYGELSNSIAVTPGQRYVLSAFFYPGNITSGTLYIDLNDASFDVQPTATIGIDQWQFAYEYFVPTVSTVNVRLVRDGLVQVGQFGFIDQVAITPAANFAPALAVPEPSTWLMLSIGTLFLTLLSFHRTKLAQSSVS